MAAKRKSGAGGKLARSEVVTVRLDQKLRYGVDLAARKHRRTASSFIEWAVERALEEVYVMSPDTRTDNNNGTSIAEVLERVWDVDHCDRLANVALSFPSLLTFDEETYWKWITDHPYFWICEEQEDGDFKLETKEEYLIRRHLRQKWETLQKIFMGIATEENLPPRKPGKLRKNRSGK